MKQQQDYDPEWAEAKRRCRLNQDDIRMAKELGFRPRSLIKNIPSKSQPWKAPVKDWIRDLYERRQKKAAHRKSAKTTQPTDRTGTTGNSPSLADKANGKTDSELVSEAERWERFLESIPITPAESELEILLAEEDDDHSPPTEEEIGEENILMLRRQKHFRMAAQYVALEFAQFPWVEKVALFGSVARPLRKEVPRFYRFRRAGVEIWHECKDVDIAVWVNQLGDLNALRKARSRAVNELQKATGGFVCVAHHQVDVFIIEPDTNDYLGRLCIFNACPKDKPECVVQDCGVHPFLQQHVGFRLRPNALSPDRMIVLFNREAAPFGDDEIPF